jgi:hypothetical protein
MTLPIRIEQVNGLFSASLIGDPAVRVEAPTRATALTQMQFEISRRMQNGEIVFMDIPPAGTVDFVGILKDDPTLDELRDEIYRLRDLEPYPE